MIPEIGMVALIIALGVAIVQASLPLLGATFNIPNWIRVARPAAYTQFLFLCIAFACLTYSFIVHDFSVAYVVQNSNSNLPLMYLISAVWGAHEGSLLLWAFILSIWTVAVARFSHNMPDDFAARVISVMGLISIGFLLFMIMTSNPFERLVPAAAEGRDLNPLLQDPGLAIHPPMLYMGYVGFSVAFALAVAAMLGGKLDAAWARWSRPWTNIAWVFMTLGITLGSWWAYYELGWGGWWFWDPVENASFMPWLVGTALIHSLAVTEKRNTFKAWTVLLATVTFSLSLLGTFLVRSGVLTSVHAFASDPGRGLFILVFLCIVVGGSLLLYAWRGPVLRSVGKFEFFSRETALLLNNVILVVVAGSVLLGTLYPLALEALGVGKISVGPPSFNSVFIPLTIPLAVLLGFGTLLRWRQDKLARLSRQLVIALITSIVLGLVFGGLIATEIKPMAIVGLTLAVWVLFALVVDIKQQFRNRSFNLAGLAAVPRSFYGMAMAHLGVVVFIVGITITPLYSTEKDVRMERGQTYELAGYQFQMQQVSRVPGPNYMADEGYFRVTHNNKPVATLKPQKRYYQAQGNPMTEAAIDDGLFRDLFVALGEPLGHSGAWSVRIYHKPFLRWIWLGAVLMALGGIVAVTDRRYRRSGRSNKTDSSGAGTAA